MRTVNLTPQELSQIASNPEIGPREFTIVLDRALTVAEHVHEHMLVTRRWMGFFRCIGWIAMVIVVLCNLAMIALVWIHRGSPDKPTTPFMFDNAIGSVAFTCVGWIVIQFARREWERMRASCDSDNRYVGKVIEVFREAVKSDNFSTRLEWHLFQLRIARFDIGPMNMRDIPQDLVSTTEQFERASNTGELRNWPAGQIAPLNQSPQKSNTPL